MKKKNNTIIILAKWFEVVCSIRDISLIHKRIECIRCVILVLRKNPTFFKANVQNAEY